MRMAWELEPLLRGREDLLDESVKTLTVLGWIEFMGRESPDVKFVKDHHLHRYAVIKGKEETAEEKRWSALLEKVDFGELTELDLALMRGVKNGYFNEDMVTGFADQMLKQRENAAIDQKLSDAWNMYKGSLQPNDKEVVAAFIDAVKAGVDRISASNLDAVVTTMRKLGYDSFVTYQRSNASPAKG